MTEREKDEGAFDFSDVTEPPPLMPAKVPTPPVCGGFRSDQFDSELEKLFFIFDLDL